LAAVEMAYGIRQKTLKIASVIKEAPTVPMLLVLILTLTAIFAYPLSPHPPLKADLDRSFLPPVWVDGGSSGHPLGTDKWGRDVLSRLIYGARISLTVAFLAIALTATVGTTIGLVSGYFGGLVDTVLMRLVDGFLAFPGILIALILAVILGPSFTNVIIIVLIVLWPRFARQVRGETLGIKENEYVVMAQAMGVSSWTIIWRHIFPNVVPTLLVLTTFEIGWVVILESTLAFLGVGIPPPNPSWGVMVAEGRENLAQAWWVALFGAIAISLTVFAFNMLGDWVRDKLDPKLRQM